MNQLIHLASLVPSYYQQINYRDPLIMIVFSIHSTFLMLNVIFGYKNKLFYRLILLTLKLFIVMLSKQINTFLSWRQPDLLQSKLITMKYFNDEGLFAVFVIALPLFLMAMGQALWIIIQLVVEIFRSNSEINKMQKQNKIEGKRLEEMKKQSKAEGAVDKKQIEATAEEKQQIQKDNKDDGKDAGKVTENVNGDKKKQ